jgi:hypothetical protein
MRNVAIVVLAVALIFVCYRLAHVENQRYALALNMCPSKALAEIPDLKCLDEVQTRTSALWNLYYGLTRD